MPTAKPKCQDFIVEVARAIRMHPENMRPGTAAGVALYRIFRVAIEAYSEDNFRRGLKDLLNNGKIILVARTTFVERDASGKYISGSTSDTKLSALPKDLPAGRYGLWTVSGDGKYADVKGKKTMEYTQHRRPLLYVVEDGLPAKVQRFGAVGSSGTVAQQIIDKMMSKRKK